MLFVHKPFLDKFGLFLKTNRGKRYELSNVWPADWLGQNPLSSLQNQINSVVHHRYYSFRGSLPGIPDGHGEVRKVSLFLSHAPFPNTVENLFIQGRARLF